MKTTLKNVLILLGWAAVIGMVLLASSTIYFLNRAKNYYVKNQGSGQEAPPASGARAAMERFSAQAVDAHSGWVALEQGIMASLKDRSRSDWNQLLADSERLLLKIRALDQNPTEDMGRPAEARRYIQALDACAAKLGDIASGMARGIKVSGSYDDKAVVTDMQAYVDSKRALQREAVALFGSDTKAPKSSR